MRRTLPRWRSLATPSQHVAIDLAGTRLRPRVLRSQAERSQATLSIAHITAARGAFRRCILISAFVLEIVWMTSDAPVKSFSSNTNQASSS